MSLRWLLRNVRFTWLIVLALSVCRPDVVWAGIGFQPVVPEELQMKTEPKAPGAVAVILFRQVDRDDRGARTAHEDNYIRIKILKEEGRKYADVEIPYWNDSGKIVNIGARTIRPDGTIASFDGRVFDKTIAKAKGIKYLAKTFTLPEVLVGSIIEYYYSIDFAEHFVFDSHWILSDELFTRDAKFTLKPYTSEYERIMVRWTWQFLPPGTPPPTEGADHVIRLEAKNIPAFPTEDFMPPENEIKGRVDFIYSDEQFETDVHRYWNSEGKKLNDRLENFVNKRKAMEQAVAQTVSPGDAPDVKLRKLYDRVQLMRNTSYEVEKTEQEEKRAKENKNASNVEDVWKRGYGNGVELTWLYLGLVRAAGVEAYGVWASDRRNYFFRPETMEVRKLDTNVVLVKLNGKDIYCDPGRTFTPFGLLTWSETGVAGLRLDKDGGTWITTMLPEPTQSRIERRATLKLTDTGDLEGKLTITFTGLEALQRRIEQRNDDDAEKKKSLEEQAQEYISAASEIELTNKPDWKTPSAPLVAEYVLKIPGWAAQAGRRALVPVGIFSATEKRLFDHANREHSVYFEFPFEKIDDVTIDLPLGWQVSSLPSPQIQDAKVLKYALNVENAKGALHITRSLSVNILLLGAKYYPALRTFFQTVKTDDDQQIVVLPAA